MSGRLYAGLMTPHCKKEASLDTHLSPEINNHTHAPKISVSDATRACISDLLSITAETCRADAAIVP